MFLFTCWLERPKLLSFLVHMDIKTHYCSHCSHGSHVLLLDMQGPVSVKPQDMQGPVSVKAMFLIYSLLTTC